MYGRRDGGTHDANVLYFRAAGRKSCRGFYKVGTGIGAKFRGGCYFVVRQVGCFDDDLEYLLVVVGQFRAFRDVDLGPRYSSFERRHIPDDIDFIGAIVDRPADLVEFGFGHVVAEGKARDGDELYGGRSDFTLGAFYPEGGNANADEAILFSFIYELVDVANRESWAKVRVLYIGRQVHLIGLVVDSRLTQIVN